MSHMVKVVAFAVDRDQYWKPVEPPEGWPPMDTNGFCEWIMAMEAAHVPVEFRPGFVEINSLRNYEGDPSATIMIGYHRPEDESERKVREFQEARDAERQRTWDLKQLAALQAKYGQSK